MGAETHLLLGEAEPLYRDAMARFAADDGCRRLWSRDATLWTGADEADWLGWLALPAESGAAVPEYAALADAARRDGVRHVVVLGMGGSSLCPDVLARSFAVARTSASSSERRWSGKPLTPGSTVWAPAAKKILTSSWAARCRVPTSEGCRRNCRLGSSPRSRGRTRPLEWSQQTIASNTAAWDMSASQRL